MPKPKNVTRTTAIAESWPIGALSAILLDSSDAATPVMIAPMRSHSIDRPSEPNTSEAMRKAASTPGRAEWDTTSEMSACLRR